VSESFGRATAGRRERAGYRSCCVESAAIGWSVLAQPADSVAEGGDPQLPVTSRCGGLASRARWPAARQANRSGSASRRAAAWLERCACRPCVPSPWVGWRRSACREAPCTFAAGGKGSVPARQVCDRAGGSSTRGLRDSRAGRYVLSSGPRMEVLRRWRVVAGAMLGARHKPKSDRRPVDYLRSTRPNEPTSGE
jgi:hypothetical protein